MSVLDFTDSDTSSNQQQQQNSVEDMPTNDKNEPSEQQSQFDIGPYDVLCGRDKHAFNNVGNRRMRVFVELYLPQYLEAPCRNDKSVIIKIVVDMIKKSGGRFLKWSSEHQRYVDLSEKKAHEKCSHAFRDMVSSRQNRKSVPNVSLSMPIAIASVQQLSSGIPRSRSEGSCSPKFPPNFGAIRFPAPLEQRTARSSSTGHVRSQVARPTKFPPPLKRGSLRPASTGMIGSHSRQQVQRPTKFPRPLQHLPPRAASTGRMETPSQDVMHLNLDPLPAFSTVEEPSCPLPLTFPAATRNTPPQMLTSDVTQRALCLDNDEWAPLDADMCRANHPGKETDAHFGEFGEPLIASPQNNSHCLDDKITPLPTASELMDVFEQDDDDDEEEEDELQPHPLNVTEPRSTW